MENKNKLDYELAPEEMEFSLIYGNLFNYWENIALSRLKWTGLEKISEKLTSTILNKQLFERGQSALFEIKDAKTKVSNGFAILPCSSSGLVNIYGMPEEYLVSSANGLVNQYVKADDIVLIKNNNLAKPTAEMLQFYCTKLAEIELTKQLNLNAHKMPLAFEIDPDTLLSAKNEAQQIMRCTPVLFKNKTVGDGTNKVKAIVSGAPYINDKLEDDYNCYVAKILTLLGLDNYVEDKHERVQSAEVNANQEYIIMNFKSYLDNAKQACEEMKKKFGFDVSVEYVLGEQIEEEKPAENNEEDDKGGQNE